MVFKHFNVKISLSFSMKFATFFNFLKIENNCHFLSFSGLRVLSLVFSSNRIDFNIYISRVFGI